MSNGLAPLHFTADLLHDPGRRISVAIGILSNAHCVIRGLSDNKVNVVDGARRYRFGALDGVSCDEDRLYSSPATR